MGRVGQVQHKAPVVALGGAQTCSEEGLGGTVRRWKHTMMPAAAARNLHDCQLQYASEQLRSEEDPVKWLRLVVVVVVVVAMVVAVRCVAAEGRALWRRAEALACQYAPVAALEHSNSQVSEWQRLQPASGVLPQSQQGVLLAVSAARVAVGCRAAERGGS